MITGSTIGGSAWFKALPPMVDPVIMLAMDINPDKRYKTARTFAEALEEALAQEEIYSAPTIAAIAPTMIATSTANAIVRTITPENPCGQCGRENRSSSHFCRHCGYSLAATTPLLTDICQIGYVSDRGQHAIENEDMLLIVQGLCTNLAAPPSPFSLFALADGLCGPGGKAAGGHEASRLAVETVADVLVPLLAGNTLSLLSQSIQGIAAQQPSSILRPTQPPETVLEQWTKDAVRQANQVVYHCNADYDTAMGSTLTVTLLYKQRMYIACIGDSRIYHYRPGQGLKCTTRDQVQITNTVGMSLLPDEIYDRTQRDPQRKYLGYTYHVPIELYQHAVEADDLLVACTDGLWCMVRDEQLEEVLARGGAPQEIARRLLDAANDAGGKGNVSVIVVRVQ